MIRSVGVLGGGVAGLALAALLAHRGHRVTVYERDVPGGKLRRVTVAGETVDTGPSLFTFPQVWRAYLRELGEPDPLDLQPLPGGLGTHHTPYGPVPLPVPPGHPLFPAWTRYLRAAAPLEPHLLTLLTTPPRLRDPAFRRASAALFQVTAPHPTAHGWLRAQRLPPALTHALATHALNAGLSPADAPALYALIPALAGASVSRPARGMGALLDALLSFCAARGVQVHAHTPVTGVAGSALTLGSPQGVSAQGVSTQGVSHDLLVSAMDPARLARLRGRCAPSPQARRTVSGVALYAAQPTAMTLPATSVIPPDDFHAFRRALRLGAAPAQTLALVHARGSQLSVLLAAPPDGARRGATDPWVQAQLRRIESTLGHDLLRGAPDVAVLAPHDYAAGGHPGGALYGAALSPWRGGPLHPQSYRLGPALWQVGTGVHPGGGLPALLGSVQIVARLLAEAGW